MWSQGTNIQGMTADAALAAAGLDWTLEKRELATSAHAPPRNFNIVVPNHFALVRSTDDAVMDVVGSRYKVHQNAEIFDAMRTFMERGGATLDHAGSLRDGRVIWCRADLGIRLKLPGRDEVGGFIIALSPHEGGRSTLFRSLAHRYICENMFTSGIGEGQMAARFSHSSVFDARHAVEVIGAARESMSEFQRNARLLQKLNLSWNDAVRILAPVYQPGMDKLLGPDGESTDLYRRELDALIAEPAGMGASLSAVMDAYAKAPGAQPGTGWGVLNAVTYHADHQAGRSPDARLTSAWIGTEAARKTKVYSRLLALAA